MEGTVKRPGDKEITVKDFFDKRGGVGPGGVKKNSTSLEAPWQTQ